MIFLTDQGLLMAESVARVTAKGHSGANGEVLAIAQSVDRNPRIQTGVGIHCYTYTWKTKDN